MTEKYLALRNQPVTKETFKVRYGITLEQGRLAVKKICRAYAAANPLANVSYQYLRGDDLTKIFEGMGRDYFGLLQRVETVDCRLMPLHSFIDMVCTDGGAQAQALF